MEASAEPRNGRNRPFVVAGVACAAALVMVLFVFRKQGLVANAGDPYTYGALAHELVDHGFTKLTRRIASLYPHALAVIYWLGGNDLAAQLMHVAFHTGTCTLVFVMGRRVFNERTGLVAGLFCAVHPMLLRYVADLHMETMLTFMCTLTVFLAVRFRERPTVPRGVALGGVGMLGVLTKGVLLPFLVLYGALWLYLALRKRNGSPQALLGALAMFATMAVVVAPWTYRNYKVTGGKFVLLTPGTPDAFLRGYIFTRVEFATLQLPPYTYAENESNELFRRLAKEAGTTWELDEVEDDVNNGVEMRRMIREHPFLTVRKVVVGLFTFWYEMTSLKNSLVPLSLALLNWALAFVGIKRARAERRPFWLFLMPVVVLNAFVAALVPLGRYSVPILPCLAILAAFGVDTLLERARSKNLAPNAVAG